MRYNGNQQVMIELVMSRDLVDVVSRQSVVKSVVKIIEEIDHFKRSALWCGFTWWPNGVLCDDKLVKPTMSEK